MKGTISRITDTIIKETEEIKKEKLMVDIANYISLQKDHNIEKAVKTIMKIIDEFKWWMAKWHKSIKYKGDKINWEGKITFEQVKDEEDKTNAGPKPDPRLISYIGSGAPKRRKKEKTKLISADFVKGYLDGCIMKWRNELGISKTKEDKLIAKCNIDTYQSVRVSLLGELLPKEEK